MRPKIYQQEIYCALTLITRLITIKNRCDGYQYEEFKSRYIKDDYQNAMLQLRNFLKPQELHRKLFIVYQETLLL